MCTYNYRHHKINQIFLKAVGLWPYEKTKFALLRAICVSILSTSYMFVQLGQFVVVDFNIDVAIRILSDAFPAVIFFLKFNMFFFSTKTMKQILEHVMRDRRILIDAQEIKIMDYYARQGMHFMIFVMSIGVISICGIITLILLPDILYFVRPLNKSRVHYLPLFSEYRGYQDAYFYPIFLYIAMSSITGCIVMLSIGMLFVFSVLHCCAMYKISSCRIERVVDNKMRADLDKQNIMVERIIRSVKLHRNAQDLTELIVSNYSTFFLALLLVGLASLSINLFRLIYAITQKDNTELMVALAYVLAHELYFFAGNYSGQLIIDHANDLFNSIYKSLWYIAPLRVQKLLLFMMLKSTKGSNLNANGLFISSLEGFTTLSSMSMSYFMVIYSKQ